MGFRKPKRSQRQYRRAAALRRRSNSPPHTLSLGRLEHLEDRRFLSFNVGPSTWTPIGPAPILNGQTPGNQPVSGQINGIASDPDNANVIYAAAAGGGVWKSTDAGNDWTPLTDHLAEASGNPIPLFMGSIAVEHEIPAQPSSPLVIYAGTGDPNNESDAYPTNAPSPWATESTYGRGVLVGIDDGVHPIQWNLYDGPVPFGGTAGAFERQTISKIVVDPTNPNTVYAAVSNNSKEGSSRPDTGVWKSTDGGMTWNNTTQFALMAGGTQNDSTDPYTDLVIDPTHPNTLYTAIGNPMGANSFSFFGSGSTNLNGIYKTTDGGVTWNQLGGAQGLALPATTDTTVGRIALAISPSSPNTLYATYVKTEAAGGNLYQFLRTTDGGSSWTNLTSTPDFLTPSAGQRGTGYRNLAMAVDLNDPNTVYVAGAGENILKSSDAGRTFSTIEVDVQANGPHPNHHALVLDANDKLLDGNDGGIWRLDNPTVGALLWNDLNTNLQISQLTGVALHPTDPNTIYGGSQNNGIEQSGGTVSWTAFPVDTQLSNVDQLSGGFVRVDQVTPNVVYRTFPRYNSSGATNVTTATTSIFERSTDGGATWTVETRGLNPLNTDASDLYVPYVMDPSNSSRLLAGTDRIYESIDQGNDWNAISTPGKNGFISSIPTSTNPDPTVDAIAVPAQKSQTIYAAVGPDIFVTNDDGASWSVHDLIAQTSITATSTPINFSSRFSSLLADPNDPTGNTAYALIANFNTNAFGSANTDASGDTEHVYRTTNGGITWTNITGNLADQPMNSLAFDASTRVLYLGTDTGVFASDTYTQGAATVWNSLAPGPNSLPNSQVTDLELNSNLGLLAAATQGRGAWELQVHVLQGQTHTESEGAKFTDSVLVFNDPAGSIDPNNFQATIDWGDGSPTFSGTPGEGVTYNNGLFTLSGSHTYAEENLYLPTVSITNLTTGIKQTTNATIDVLDPLTAGTSSPLTAVEGSAIPNQQVATFVDPALVAPNTGFAEPLTDYAATIFWGDNTSSFASIVATAAAGTFAVQGSHLYAEEGPYAITVVASHDQATPVTMSTSATVSDPAVVPATGSVTFSAVDGVLSPFQPVASFKDPAGLEDISHYSATIDWGDSSPTTTGSLSINFNNSVVTVSSSHLYNQVNFTTGFPITVTIHHDLLGDTAPDATAQATAIVAYPQLVGTGGLTLNALEGATSTSQPLAKFTDPSGNDPVLSDYSAIVFWGDGSSSNSGPTDISLANGTFTVAGSHAYAEESPIDTPYTVRVVLNHGSATPGSNALPDTVVSSATVADQPVVFGIPQTFTATEGATATNVTVATFSDPAGNPAQDETGGPTGTGPFDYSATINWGDGTSTTTGTISLPDANGVFTVSGSHAYAEENSAGYQVTVVVHHDTAADVTLTSTADVVDAAPVATGGYKFQATEGAPSALQPVATFQDPAGAENVGDYQANIDWGDGTSSLFNSPNVSISATGGLFTVFGLHDYLEEPTNANDTITVTILHDPLSNPPDTVTATATSQALVSDPQLVAIGNFAFTATEGAQPTQQTLATFTDPGDPGGAELLGDYSATIAWGDGQISTDSVTPPVSGTYAVQATHIYSEEGFYPIAVTIHHGTALDVKVNSAAQVNDAPLVVTGNQTFNATEAAMPATNQVLATFTDPGGSEPLSDPLDGTLEYSATVNWGDGTSSTSTSPTTPVVIVGPDVNGVFSVTGNHTYTVEGTYPISVTIRHDSAFDATLPAGQPVTAVVVDPPVVPGSGTTFAAVEGIVTPVQAVATFTDPTGSEALANYSAKINWNDGTPIQTGQITWNASTQVFTVNASHTYPEGSSPPLIYPYTVTIHHGPPGVTLPANVAAPDVTISGSASVSGQKVIASGGFSFTATEGMTATNLAVATFTDPGFSAPNPEPTANYSASIDWGDSSGTSTGTISLNTATGQFSVVGSHLYAMSGPYNVAVTIQHDGFGVGTTSVGNVLDATLQATGGATYTATEGAAGPNQVLATFTDPGGPESQAHYTATVAWGDGSSTPGVVAFNSLTQTFSVSGGHLYSDEQVNSGITVAIHHDTAPDATANDPANIADPQIVGASVSAAVAALSTNVPVATFTDPGGPEDPSHYSAGIAWGDGSTTAGTITFNSTTGAFTVSGNPPPSLDDTSNGVVVTISHMSLPPITVNSTIVVGEGPINVVGAPVAGHEFTPLSNVTVATFTHGAGREPTSEFAATIAWGDGATTVGTVRRLGLAYAVAGSHTYGDEGTDTVQVTVSEEGVTATSSGVATIATETLPIAGPATPSEKYVAEVYTDVLHRQVDAGGLQFWSNQLDQGQSRDVVAANLIHTPEYFALIVNPLYEKYLGRPADQGGLNFWIGQLLNGETDEQVEAGFIGSPEYFARAGGTNLAWVDAMYNDLLGRPADPAGEQSWINSLANGESRAQVALGFTTSPEREVLRIQEDYFQFLGRAATPSEVDGLVNSFEHGATDEVLIQGFIASDEYYNRVQAFPS